MSAFDIYIFVLSLIVLILLTTLSVVVITIIVRMSCRLIRVGAEDEKILAEANRIQTKREKIGKVINDLISLLFAMLFIVAFLLSTLVSCTQDVSLGQTPVFRVVNSDSMSKQNPKNKYLFENDLGNQFDTFDLIITYEIPPEDELELYDIVVYKLDDMYIIHRIIEIQPPDSSHPNATYYRLQGDAEARADMLPVTYDQMIAIYRGQRVPFIGSFVKFMQSPAGSICILLVITAMIAGPLADKKLENERAKRLALLLGKAETVEQKRTLETQVAEKTVAEVPLSANAEYLTAEKVTQIENDDEPMPTYSEPLEEFAVTQEENKYAFGQKRDTRSFKERLADSPDIAQERYAKITEYLQRIHGVRVISGKKFETYKCRSVQLLRFAVRGKTLNAYIALPCEAYSESKYVFDDVSAVKTHENYPMRVKVSSTRKTRWTIELLQNIVKENGLTLTAETLEEEPLFYDDTPVETGTDAFAFRIRKRDTLSFKEKLEKSPDVTKERYAQIVNVLSKIKGVRILSFKKFETYKYKNLPIARLAVRGKTLNVFLGLPCKDYENSKYIFTDVSQSKRYKNYPMRLKLTSKRQTRWAIELLQQLFEKGNVPLTEVQDEN